MEYSLEHLNKRTNLKNIELNNFIEKLNVIGLEVDDIIFEKNNELNNLNDIKLVIKIPADRDDLINQIILDEELSMIFLFKIYKIWEKIRKNYLFLLKNQYLNNSNYSIRLVPSSVKAILTYAIKIKNYQNKETPNWILEKLKNLEISKNKKSNILNHLIQLIFSEYGQNFNVLNSNQQILKIESLQKIENVFLDNQEYLVNKNTIVLKNENNKILSILGILNHCIEEKNVLLESTFYDIGENTLNLNDINTDLSYRYLRRAFINNFKNAFQRLLTLIEIITEGEIEKTIYKSETKKSDLKPFRILKIENNAFKQFLNIEKYDKEIFEKAGLKIVCKTRNEIYLRIPFFRKDLKREIDLIEEYTRFIGYKNFSEILPKITFVNKNNKNNKNEFIKQFFIMQNFNEIFTNSLISDIKVKKNSIGLQNPLNSDFCLLRSSLVDNILEIFLKNLRFGINSLKFFEIGRIYKLHENKFIEEEYLTAIFPIEINKNLDTKLDWFIAKGFVESFLSSFSNKIFIFEKLTEKNDFYHPNKTVKIKLNDKVIGFFGEIHPKYRKLNLIKQNIYCFELNLQFIKVSNLKSNIKVYKEFSKYPIITKDLSLLVEKNTNFAEFKKFIVEQLKDLKNIQFFDIYFDEKITNKISLGIRLEFQSFLKTLLNEDIESEIQKLLFSLNKNFNIELKD